MQKQDISKVTVGQRVTVVHGGKNYTAKVIRLPLIKDGVFSKNGFKPQQFKLEVEGDDEWAGNRYAMWQAVHTPEADKAQKARAVAEAEAKAQKKAVAQKGKKADITKGLNISELAQLAQALKTLNDLGFDVTQVQM